MTSKHRLILLLVLTALTVAVYANSLPAPFYLDDGCNITDNQYARLTELSWDKMMIAGFESPLSNRPIANITFGLNYFFGYYNPTGYRIVNIIIHIVNGILLYLFVMATTRVRPDLFRHVPRDALAFFTALIWLAHPLQTQSVTYIVQRMNSMSAMFYLASLLFYIQGRITAEHRKKWLWFSACIVSWILALGSKEIAVSLPVFVFLYEWFFFRHCSISWIRSNLRLLAGALLVLGLAVLLYTDFDPMRAILSGYAHRDFTPLQRIFTQFRVIVFYVGLVFYPHPGNLSLLYDFDVSRTLIDPPTTLLCAAALAAVLFWACRHIRKDPLISFSILWFFGNLALESSVVSLEIIFEHRTYLPSMLAVFAIATLTFRAIKRPAAAVILLCLVTTVFSLSTYERNALWADEIAFWKDCATKAPKDVRVYHSLARAYQENERFDQAATTFQKALALDPGRMESLLGLGQSLREQGNIRGAVAAHRRAVEIAPTCGDCYNQLGTDYIKDSRIHLAVEALEKAIVLAPFSYRAHSNLGVAYSRIGKVSEAVRMYDRAIAIRPDFAEAYNNLGILFLNPQESQKAVAFLQRAISLDPRFADAHGNLGVALIHGGQFAQGIRAIQAALALAPDHEDATFNLARAYELTGKYAPAVDQYKKSIRLNPTDAQAYFNAGFLCLHQLADTDQAMDLFKKGIAIAPDHEQAKTVRTILSDTDKSHQRDA